MKRNKIKNTENLKAVDIAKSGKLGEIKIFNFVFTLNVLNDSVLADKRFAGRASHELGIYNLNDIHTIFNDEPIEVSAFVNQEKFTLSLRFSRNRLANIICNFGTTMTSAYEVIGTKGILRVSPAFDYKDKVIHHKNSYRKERYENNNSICHVGIKHE